MLALPSGPVGRESRVRSFGRSGVKGTRPDEPVVILLLDDVSSELDEQRNAYLFEYLATLAGQCFVTTTHRKHVLVASGNRVDYLVREGQISLTETTS